MTSIVTACAAAGKMPPPSWTEPAVPVEKIFSPTARELGESMSPASYRADGSSPHSLDLGAIHSIGNPVHLYPLYENGFRAHRDQSIKENHEESTKMYAEFAKVAERQPYAWNYGKQVSEKDIGTVEKRNRMICFPCK